MALIKCPECKSEVSDKASSCLVCGYPIMEHKRKKESLQRMKEVGKIARVVVGVFSILLCMSILSAVVTSGLNVTSGIGVSGIALLTMGFFLLVSGGLCILSCSTGNGFHLKLSAIGYALCVVIVALTVGTEKLLSIWGFVLIMGVIVNLFSNKHMKS